MEKIKKTENGYQIDLRELSQGQADTIEILMKIVKRVASNEPKSLAMIYALACFNKEDGASDGKLEVFTTNGALSSDLFMLSGILHSTSVRVSDMATDYEEEEEDIMRCQNCKDSSKCKGVSN